MVPIIRGCDKEIQLIDEVLIKIAAATREEFNACETFDDFDYTKISPTANT